MKGRVNPPGCTPDSPLLREVSSEVERLIAAGRDDLPASDLPQRVREAVSYRRVLAGARPGWLPSTPSQRTRGVPMLAGSLAVAACALLWWHAATRKHPVSITPEPVASAAGLVANERDPGGSQAQNPAGLPTLHTQHGPATGATTGGGATPVVADPCLRRATAAGKQPLIDDFEDGDDEVLRLENRSGLWRWARDTDAPGSAPALLPIPRNHPSADNRMALHVKGGRLLDWGAIVEFNFKPGCYDASAYGGLKFQAKGPGRVFVTPREIRTIPIAEGGTCTSDCYNPHVKKIELERQWKTYRVEWHEFEQRGYARPAFDPKRLHSFAILIRPEDTPYDVWFDDVSFISR